MKTFTANTGASKQNMPVYIWKKFTIQGFGERLNILIKLAFNEKYTFFFHKKAAFIIFFYKNLKNLDQLKSQR